MKTYIIAKMKSKKLVHFKNTQDLYSSLKNVISWRQIEAKDIKSAFTKFNN